MDPKLRYFVLKNKVIGLLENFNHGAVSELQSSFNLKQI